ncbi:MAG: DUF4352 domain-containing protein [Chloroflexota bacterium]|jgi:cell division septation protein DedD
MPSGSPFDPYKAVKVNDVVELPDVGLVLQVVGAKTADYDAQRNMLLVDLILGNNGSEKYTVSSVLLMDAVSGDWKWYGLTLDELMQAATKIAALNVKTFDTDLAPGDARKGTAVMLVPKDAKELAFAFTPMDPNNPLKQVQTVFVSLGIEGEFPFPILPEDATVATAGTVYKVGQPVKAEKRGLTLQVNSFRERTESVKDAEIDPEDKMVLVDVTGNPADGAKPLNSLELYLIGPDGDEYRANAKSGSIIREGEKSRSISDSAFRGLVAFEVPRSSKGFQLKFKPIDFDNTQTLIAGAPMKYLEDEEIIINLDGSESAPAASSETSPSPASPASTTETPTASTSSEMATTTPAAAEATPTPEWPTLTDESAVPQELKAIPVPSGFSVVKGSTLRSTSGGQFEQARATYYGKMSIKDATAFFTESLANDWYCDGESVSDDDANFEFTNKENESQILYLYIYEVDGGLEIEMELSQY